MGIVQDCSIYSLVFFIKIIQLVYIVQAAAGEPAILHQAGGGSHQQRLFFLAAVLVGAAGGQHAGVQQGVCPLLPAGQGRLGNAAVGVGAAQHHKADGQHRNADARRRDRLEHPHQQQHAPHQQHCQEPPGCDPARREAEQPDIRRQLGPGQQCKRHAETAEQCRQRFRQRPLCEEMHPRQHGNVQQLDAQQLPESIHRKGRGFGRGQARAAQGGGPLSQLQGKKQTVQRA